MRFTIFFLLILISPSFGLDNKVIDFALDFFQIKDIRFICLLTCEDTNWNRKFVERASSSSIAVSSVKIDSSSHYLDHVTYCLGRDPSSGVFTNSKCAGFQNTLLLASENEYFDNIHKWLVVDVDDATNDTNVAADVEMSEHLLRHNDTFSKLNLSVNADIILSVQKGGKNDIYDVYNFGKVRGGDVVISKLGNWDDKSVLFRELKRYRYYRRWDFNQSSINFIAVMSPPPKKFEPDMIIGNQPEKGIAIMTITAMKILEEVKELHNIRYNYTIVDNWIGDYQRNSTRWVSTALYFKEQDVTPFLRIKTELVEKLDMLLPSLTSVETRYYYRIPTDGVGKFENQFLRPLTTGAWACVTAVSALCGLMLLLAARAERRPSSTQYALFSVLATLCQQFYEDNGYLDDPRRVSTARQLVILVTGASCVLIYNYYTSSVVSWLLNGPPPSINSLEELLESPLSLIYQDAGYTRTWLEVVYMDDEELLKNPIDGNLNYYYNKKNSEIEEKLRIHKVFTKKKGSRLLVPLEEGIEMVKAGGYAYHTEVYIANTLIARSFTQEELCELGSLQSIEKTPTYAAMPKNSPYKEFYTWNLLRLQETGVVARYQPRIPAIGCEGSSPRALALGGAAPAFLLLAFGFVLANVILLMERFIARSAVFSRIRYRFLEKMHF